MALFGKLTLFKGPAAEERWLPAISLDQGAIGAACCAMNRNGVAQAVWENRGRIWTQSMGLGQNGARVCFPLGPGRDPRMAVNLNGSGVIVWVVDGPEGRTLLGLPLSVGKTPESPHVLFSTAGAIRHLQLGADRRGGALAVWVHELDGEFEVMARHFDLRSLGWEGPPIGLGPKRPAPVEPHLAMNRRGQAVVVWNEPAVGASGLMGCYYFPSMGQWSDCPVNLAAGPVQAFQVALDHAGNLMLLMVRQDFEQRPRLEARVHSAASSSWQPAEVLASAQQFSQVRLAVTGSGEAQAVWLQNEGSAVSYLHARAYRAGAWEPRATRLEPGEGRVDEFALALGLRGSASVLCIVRHQGDRYLAVHERSRTWGAPGTLGTRAKEPMNQPLVSFCAHGAVAIWRSGEGEHARLRMSQRFAAQPRS